MYLQKSSHYPPPPKLYLVSMQLHFVSMECILISLQWRGLEGFSHVPSKAGLPTDGPGGLSLVGSCRRWLTPAIFARNDSVIPCWQSTEPEVTCPFRGTFKGLLQGESIMQNPVVFISVTGHGPALTLVPGPKPQPAVGLVLDIANDSLLCSDV